MGTGWDFCEAASSLPEPKEKSDEILLADFPSVDTIVMLDPEEQLYFLRWRVFELESILAAK